DGRDARGGQACGVTSLRPEPGEEGRLGAVLRLEQLDRDDAGEALVVGAPHLAHAADGDERLQAVAPRDEPLGLGGHLCSTALMTWAAMGAATFPPVASLPRAPPFSTSTATATTGFCAGAKAMNHA